MPLCMRFQACSAEVNIIPATISVTPLILRAITDLDASVIVIPPVISALVPLEEQTVKCGEQKRCAKGDTGGD